MEYRKLWIALGAVLAISFLVLGGVGYRSIHNAPPIPQRVATTDGRLLFDGTTIQDGQNVWQSLGGQEIGSIFGHGAYVAPDWTADYLHREATILQERGIDPKTLRINTYDPATKTLTISNERAAAFEQLATYYGYIFAHGRTAYAIPQGALTDTIKQRQMAAFFFWTSWVASTNRPGGDVTYTQNWPHEELIGNRPTSAAIMWSMASVFLLLAGIGAMIWYFGSKQQAEHTTPPSSDPLLELKATPSQKATIKYFVVVAALFIVQLIAGGIAAHYGVEGNGFYGFPLDKYLPYSIVRTWHLQIGIFWIATSWLATGLFLAPAIGGQEPKGQRLGVNVLFAALILVVGGSLTGEWLGIQQKLGKLWFWLGAQGYEYVDLGRLWQILLFGGLVFWLWLMWRAIKPALFAQNRPDRSLLLLFLTSAIAIPMFYGAGLMYGQRSHIVTAEFWRWWVVHLWVEGFFEVFATVAIAYLFTRLGVLTVRTATKATLLSSVIFLFGGIIGTFHHLYFTGMPNSVLALGAVFSAMEIVPLCLVGFEAWENIRIARGTTAKWLATYKWPIYFFVAVAFWNLVGAGLFGFLINPPVALYYMQGLNLTPVHGHTALFGVYGMLGIGLMLFTLRALTLGRKWNEAPLRFAFWAINIGLLLMVTLSMLPIGIAQTVAAIDHGTWYARSAEFLQTPWVQNVRWLRAFGDSCFTVGALALGYFIVRVSLPEKKEKEPLALANGVRRPCRR